MYHFTGIKFISYSNAFRLLSSLRLWCHRVASCPPLPHTRQRHILLLFCIYSSGTVYLVRYLVLAHKYAPCLVARGRPRKFKNISLSRTITNTGTEYGLRTLGVLDVAAGFTRNNGLRMNVKTIEIQVERVTAEYPRTTGTRQFLIENTRVLAGIFVFPAILDGYPGAGTVAKEETQATLPSTRNQIYVLTAIYHNRTVVSIGGPALFDARNHAPNWLTPLTTTRGPVCSRPYAILLVHTWCSNEQRVGNETDTNPRKYWTEQLPR